MLLSLVFSCAVIQCRTLLSLIQASSMSLSDIILIPVTGKERKPDSSLSTSHLGDFFFSYF